MNPILLMPFILLLCLLAAFLAYNQTAIGLNSYREIWRAVRKLPWKERLACFLGRHPRNPKAFVPYLRYYVTTCMNGDAEWHEKCPRCCRWHREPEQD